MGVNDSVVEYGEWSTLSTVDSQSPP